MKSIKPLGIGLLSLALSCAVALKSGCSIGGDFLGLEDYQRDLLLGGLAAAVLLSDGTLGAGDNTDPGAGQPLPGPEGPEGPAGPAGPQGSNGQDGQDGGVGPQGPAGPRGPDGPAGPAGPEGPPGSDGADGQDGTDGADGRDGLNGADGQSGLQFFDMFIDDFFKAAGTQSGDLPIQLVIIREPALGMPSVDERQVDALAYRTAIPQLYDPGNDVLMRLFFHRRGRTPENCFIFSIEARRLRDGSDVECYGGAGTGCEGGTRWIRVEPNAIITADPLAEALLGDGETFVIDLPVNTAAGLGYPSVDVADFLAFELSTFEHDGGLWHLLGVEFIEKRPGTAVSDGVTIFNDIEDARCDEECFCHADVVTSCTEPPSDGPGGAFVDYELPTANEECRIVCLEDAREAPALRTATDPNLGNPCEVVCDPPPGSFFPVGDTVVTCETVQQDQKARASSVETCAFTVTVEDDCPEPSALTGWWRFEFMATEECSTTPQFEDYESEVRYLYFDESNELVENRIVIPTVNRARGGQECLQVFYPSTNGPSYLGYRFGGFFSNDTDRSIVSQVFDLFIGLFEVDELVDAPSGNCNSGEEGNTRFGGTVVGDTITGEWEFVVNPECTQNFRGEPVERVCGPFTAVRLAGEPICLIVEPPDEK